MNFETDFPLRYWLNLGRRADRRDEIEWIFESAGVAAERFPAVDDRFVGRMALERFKPEDGVAAATWIPGPPGGADPVVPGREVRGYASAGRYARALTQRMAIRRAWLQGAAAVLLFEDDVVLHPNFVALVEGLELPEDWGMFHFGCVHEQEPEPAGPGIVRVTAAVGTHAFAVRAPYFRRVMEALNGHGKPSPTHTPASGRFLTAMQAEIPTYACFPNLAWQAGLKSEPGGATATPYGPGGSQKRQVELIDRAFANMFGDGRASAEAPPIALGLLFLTRGDVHHPELWREFVAEAPERVRVFSHPKYPESLAGGFLEGTAITERHETAWGSISLVRATLALLRAALAHPTLTHFSHRALPAWVSDR